MELFSLVLCLGMLQCITTASRGLSQPQHHLLERQADSSTDTCDFAAIYNDWCTSGYIQAYVTFLLECDQSDRETTMITALSLTRSCESSSSGTLCENMDTSTLRSTFETNCRRSLPTTCSSDCLDFLTTIRAELGCCINYFNNTDFAFRFTAVFEYSLWSLCNVEQVAECAPGPVVLPETITIDPTCNDSTFWGQLLYEVVCRAQYFESPYDLENCVYVPGNEINNCLVNEEGRYCRVAEQANAADTSTGDLFADPLAVYTTNCANTSTCDPLCVQALGNITSCCFINDYNRTLPSYDWLSYEFWSMCGLDSPGFCETKFNDDPVNAGGASNGSGNVNLVLLPWIPIILAYYLIIPH